MCSNDKQLFEPSNLKMGLKMPLNNKLYFEKRKSPPIFQWGFLCLAIVMINAYLPNYPLIILQLFS